MNLIRKTEWRREGKIHTDVTSGSIKVLTIEGDLSNFTQCNNLSRGVIFKTEIFNEGLNGVNR